MDDRYTSLYELRPREVTIDLTLQYKATDDKLIGYSDADWANDLDNRRSTTGNIFLMSGPMAKSSERKGYFRRNYKSTDAWSNEFTYLVIE